MLVTDDVEEVFNKAIKNGATIDREITEQTQRANPKWKVDRSFRV
jgi:uncharacterized glyoxalase superfamily protein PhnB